MIEDYFIVVSVNVCVFVKVFVYVVFFNRTFAIFLLSCRCDKVWSGYDDVFSVKC